MTTTKQRLIALVLFLAAFIPQSSKAQIFDNRTGVDTLTLGERISLRTNFVDWTLLTPNVGVEFDVRNTNWNRWAVGLTLKSKWKTSSTFKQEIFYNITEARVDFRNYWRTRQIDGDKVKAHTGFIDRLFSCRRRVVKHPKTTYYRGVYASVSDFSVKLGNEGRQGKAVSAGVTYGIIKPLYVFTTGNSLDLDFGFDAGIVATNAEKFKLDREANCYVRKDAGTWKIVPFPMPTSARVGLVYRFGKYPVTKKYRWRYDADAEYQYRLDTLASNNAARAYSKHLRDSVQNGILDEFWQAYDSAAVVNAKKASEQRVVLARQKAEADKQRAIDEQKEKERQRLEKETKKKAPEKKKDAEPADTTAVKADTVMVATEENTELVDTATVYAEPTDSVQTEGTEPADSVATETPEEDTPAVSSEQPATDSEQPTEATEPPTPEQDTPTTEPETPAPEPEQPAEPTDAPADDNVTTSNNPENENDTKEGKEATDEQ